MRGMGRSAAVSTAVLFFIWLLPLGVFIKPAQEKLACGGRRAVCLCSHQQEKAEGKAVQARGFQNPSGSNEKEPSSSGGGSGNFFVAFDPFVQDTFAASVLNVLFFFAYHDPFIGSLEHVPKTKTIPSLLFL